MGCPRQAMIVRDLASFREDNPLRPKIGDQGVFYDKRLNTYRVEMAVPCGKCETCNAARAQQWAIRCACELMEPVHSDYRLASFITLTYSDDNLPPDGKVHKEHLQKFFRRLRKKIPHIRYFACGEYGDQTRRPHYHAIIFGADFMGDATPFNGEHFISPQLNEIWGLGHTTTTPATYSTICYTVGYVAKKIGDPDVFQLPSRRPGLGAAYIAKFEDDIRRTGSITIEGREYPLPEYFFTREDFDDLKAARRAEAQARPAKSWQQQKSRHVNAVQKTKRIRGEL